MLSLPLDVYIQQWCTAVSVLGVSVLGLMFAHVRIRREHLYVVWCAVLIVEASAILYLVFFGSQWGNTEYPQALRFIVGSMAANVLSTRSMCLFRPRLLLLLLHAAILDLAQLVMLLTVVATFRGSSTSEVSTCIWCAAAQRFISTLLSTIYYLIIRRDVREVAEQAELSRCERLAAIRRMRSEYTGKITTPES